MSNKIKSVYIGLFPLGMIGIVVMSILQLFGDPIQFSWWGALLTAVPISFLFMRLMVLKDKARTSARLPVCQFLAVAGFGLALAGTAGGAEPIDGAVAALVGLIGLTLYIYWYSSFGRRPSGLIAVGKTLPEFEMMESDGTKVMSHSYVGHPAIFMFYRGNWCPLCMAQIDELAALYRDLEEFGVKTVLISPQPHSHSRKLADRLKLDFDFMVDQDGAAAQQLEIEIKNGLPLGLSMLGYAEDTVMPTVFLTDAGGRIIFADQTDNYRVRPEPQTFLRIFREQLAG